MREDFYEPHLGDPALILESCPHQRTLSRTNYFSLYWFREGKAQFTQELHSYEVLAPALCCVNTYQPHAFEGTAGAVIQMIRFHANFLCIETYHDEVGCNGVLFNQNRPPQAVIVPQEQIGFIQLHFDAIQDELNHEFSGRHDALLSHLKLLLIQATRLKLTQIESKNESVEFSPLKEPVFLQMLPTLLDQHFREEKSIAFYASQLEITPHLLQSALKKHWSTSLSNLLQTRLLKEAKWQLLHTDLSVKCLSADLNFRDEFYFSRWFKKHTGFSPSHFRAFEWKIRGISKSP